MEFMHGALERDKREGVSHRQEYAVHGLVGRTTISEQNVNYVEI